jgi:O-acetyl-ADP-ribose deacetylase (regulator of RNase III)
VDEVDDEPGYRFGRTRVLAVTGDLLAQDVDAIVVAANRRGMLGPLATPGPPGLRSLGGSAIERAAMALAPLELGRVALTGAPGLEQRGVRVVLHAVVHPALGERARVEDVRRAVAAIVQVAAQRRLRSLAIPLLGVESLASPAETDGMVTALVDELVGSLRRSAKPLDRVTIVCRFAEEAASVEVALARALERDWPPA